jgi:hypothetical protein
MPQAGARRYCGCSRIYHGGVLTIHTRAVKNTFGAQALSCEYGAPSSFSAQRPWSAIITVLIDVVIGRS